MKRNIMAKESKPVQISCKKVIFLIYCLRKTVTSTLAPASFVET